eukprot:CAMPEP_0204646132 /NCGR_PEP_ID=MMETSP0718-20130828/4088_1 /ASSEMBLY_ACC=CAM_ASM_000674 /TAXON_ID=230516 /ORGANISM="Chaetoceros curvisetus" /LENGTH=237 /DNA_ID=CAMNT_0051668293 /DNA_START=31 /DNA_END=741 /DNA_ORIENTATION=+
MAKEKKTGIHAVPDERNIKDPRRKLPAKPMLPSKRVIQNFDTPTSELTPMQRCELIAEISEAVLEDPHAAVVTPKENDNHGSGGAAGENDEDDDDEMDYSGGEKSKMIRLLELGIPDKNGHDETTTRLAILSMLAIFQDIIPTYRIRLPTAAERSVRVTKETKKVWDYERAFLTVYQRYLKLLNLLWESGCGKETKRNNAALSTLSVTAILCLTELLKSAPHFNFRSNILSIISKQM